MPKGNKNKAKPQEGAVNSKVNAIEAKVKAVDKATKLQKEEMKQQIAKLMKQMPGTKLKPAAARWIRQAIYPQVKGQHQRLMDEFDLDTAIIGTRTVVPVNANNIAGSNSDKGRFSAVIALSGLPLKLQDGRSGWVVGKNAASFGPTSASLGTSGGVSNNYLLSVKCAQVSPSIIWSPGSTLDDGAWKFTPDSQAPELFGTVAGVDYTFAGNYGQGLSGGMVKTIRTLAMSVWFRCSESAFLNGGDVACARYFGTYTGDIFPLNGPQTNANASLANWNLPGPLMNFENVAALPDSFQGNLKDGTYCWWQPLTEIPPQSAYYHGLTAAQNPVNYEALLVAGQAQPDNAGNFPSQIGFLEINTVYEFTTADQFIEQKSEAYDPEALAQAQHFLSTLPGCMSNSGHRDWLKSIFKALAGIAAGGLTFATGGLAAPAIAAGLATAKAADVIF